MARLLVVVDSGWVKLDGGQLNPYVSKVIK